MKLRKARGRRSVTALAAVLVVACGATSAMAAADSVGLPKTMHAAAIDAGGGPEVLMLHELPVPQPKANEVVIAVSGAGVGVWEQKFREHPPADARFPVILGSDGAGTIVAVGPGVRGFKLGDQVYGTGDAFYAEYASVPVDDVVRLPRGVRLEAASALAISGLSALQGLDDVLRIKAGESVLIHGASGAVGTIAIQLAKLRGARVLATVTNEEGAVLVRRLQADAVVNGRTEDITAAARRFAPGGIDAVLGLAGGEGLEQSIEALRRDGRGRVAYLYGMEPLPKPRYAIRMTLYSFIAGRRELERLNATVAAAAKFEVPIAAAYPLSEAAEAHRRLAAGHLLGKVVLRVRSAT